MPCILSVNNTKIWNSMTIQSCNLTVGSTDATKKQEEIGLYIRYISIYPWNIGIFYDFGLFSSPRIRTRPGGVWRIDAILFGQAFFEAKYLAFQNPFWTKGHLDR